MCPSFLKMTHWLNTWDFSDARNVSNFLGWDIIQAEVANSGVFRNYRVTRNTEIADIKQYVDELISILSYIDRDVRGTDTFLWRMNVWIKVMVQNGDVFQQVSTRMVTFIGDWDLFSNDLLSSLNHLAVSSGFVIIALEDTYVGLHIGTTGKYRTDQKRWNRRIRRKLS